MGYVFDTDIVSNVVKARPHPGLLARLARLDPEEQLTTAITIGELVYGAHRTDRAEEILERIADGVLRTTPVLPFDAEAAGIYGRLRANLERAGRPLPEPDLRIASIVLAGNHVLVTGNVRHFERVPDLQIENWLEGRSP